MKKKFNDDLFEYLDWILKKTPTEPVEKTVPYPFLTNRWLSMANPNIATIVNFTTNRWICSKNEFWSDGVNFGRYFNCILPKITKKINYIKKSSKETSHEDYSNIANALQISIREVEMYEKTLAELNGSIK